jgi:hypothetical protein
MTLSTVLFPRRSSCHVGSSVAGSPGRLGDQGSFLCRNISKIKDNEKSISFS